ncbi:MAG: thioredoxin family protein [Cryobacterium sp.]
MNKKMLGTVVAIAAAVALSLTACAGAAGSSPSAPSATSAEQSAPDSATSGGAYVDYTEELLADTAGTRVLFFHASWCPQCRALESSIKAGPIPDGLTIFKVDYDNSTELRQKYGVTQQTTVVYIDDKGTELSKKVLYDDSSLDALIAAGP